MDNLEWKRDRILKIIDPICHAFGIDEFDYVVDKDSKNEYLVLPGGKISCTSNSESAIMDELIGYLFVKRYCRHRAGYIPTPAINAVQRYWV